MCSMKTEAMKSRLITSTGTGPLTQQRKKDYHTVPHTHKFPLFAVTSTRARALERVQWRILLMSFGNKVELLLLKEGLSGGLGWRVASLSSSIAMPTISSAAPSSPRQEAVIELTFQSGSFNEALRPASNAGTNMHSIYNTVWRVCSPSTAGETHSITTTASSITTGQLRPGDRTASLILWAKMQQNTS